jgi:hypothetical protein
LANSRLACWALRQDARADVEVHHNAVSNNRNGITTVYAHRDNVDTLCPGPDGQHQLKNLWVHDNTITEWKAAGQDPKSTWKYGDGA